MHLNVQSPYYLHLLHLSVVSVVIFSRIFFGGILKQVFSHFYETQKNNQIIKWALNHEVNENSHISYKYVSTAIAYNCMHA